MFQNSPTENLISHRNRTIILQCKSIYWFLHDLSLNWKELFNSSEYKNQILYNTHKYELKMYKKMYKNRAEVTINLRYLFSLRSYSFQNLSPVLFSSRGIWTICFVNQCNTTVSQETAMIVSDKESKSSGCICSSPLKVFL